MLRMRHVVVAVGLFALGNGGAAGQSAGPAIPVVVRAGDQVKIEVWRREEFSGEFEVRPDGRLSHPLYHEIQIAGLGVDAIENRIREYLHRFESNPQVMVEILLRIAVSGEVRQPGIYRVTAGTGLVDAIMEAGGPTESGRLSRVRVLRDGTQLEFDLLKAHAADGDATVRSGDIITLPRRTSLLRDAVAPIASVVGAIAALVSISRR